MFDLIMFDLSRRRKSKSTTRDTGSASVEFVILAIPLFLPIFIYLTQFADLSNSEIQSRSLVRQIVRAYVSSQSLDDARSRAEIVLNYGAGRLGFSQSEISAMRLTFSCSADPCLTPGARVRGNLTLTSMSSHRTVRVSAQEYVSPWQ
jgi:Flp pilus assembly protein TadG